MTITAAKTERDSKKNWELTEVAFRYLLEWLDEGLDSEGGKYLVMRRRLVTFFDRKNCVAPENLADETLNRVARRLKEEGAINSSRRIRSSPWEGPSRFTTSTTIAPRCETWKRRN